MDLSLSLNLGGFVEGRLVFYSKDNAVPGDTYTSNAITVPKGITSAAADVSSGTGFMAIHPKGSTWGGLVSSGTVSAGDQIRLTQDAGDYSTDAILGLTITGITDPLTWWVTSMEDPTHSVIFGGEPVTFGGEPVTFGAYS